MISSTKVKGFEASFGKYYVADAGYSNTPMTLTPYRGVRYHLREQTQANMKPQNVKELFNLRHSALRNAVERMIGVFKNRFRFFEAGRRNMPLKTQIEVVYALTAVYNFINMYNPDDLNSFPMVEDEENDIGMNERRDTIARLM